MEYRFTDHKPGMDEDLLWKQGVIEKTKFRMKTRLRFLLFYCYFLQPAVVGSAFIMKKGYHSSLVSWDLSGRVPLFFACFASFSNTSRACSICSTVRLA